MTPVHCTFICSSQQVHMQLSETISGLRSPCEGDDAISSDTIRVKITENLNVDFKSLLFGVNGKSFGVLIQVCVNRP